MLQSVLLYHISFHTPNCSCVFFTLLLFHTLICSTSKIGCKPQSFLTLRLMSCPITGTKEPCWVKPCDLWRLRAKELKRMHTNTHKDGGRQPASSLIVSGTERKAVRASPVFLGQSDVRMEVLLDKMVVMKIVAFFQTSISCHAAYCLYRRLIPKAKSISKFWRERLCTA